MDPATIALIGTLVREVGVPAVRGIAGALRSQGHPEMADALEAEAAAALRRSDATLDTVIDTARLEQQRG